MRDIPEEMVARIESGAATLCHAWILERADGEKVGVTDHDRDLTVEGIPCRAASGWTAGARDGAVGSQAGGISVEGALDAEGLGEDDILSGAWDQAACDCWRVDWRRPDLKVRLWRGRLSKIRREGEAFVADLEGPLGALEKVVGRTFGRGCDAVFGDRRCGVDQAAFPGLNCDKAWATCTGTFGNGDNFRGFPEIPGDDFLTAYPAGNGIYDGGSRG